MNEVIVKIENLSKQYRLGQVGTGTLSHDLNRWWHSIRGKEDPYLKIGEVNDRTQKVSSSYVWAIKDINFDVKKGEVLGIIGKNGAGKSTLLKILSKVTGPTTGSIKAKGRIAALLEVGTGFHPEMTGRENIFMNGTIMGMNRHEIAAKLEEIVEFAGVAMYLDTPVKRYSSGMMVRLGFAIAAHLEPEILIVDEVLAVGDMEFQKKAIGKMKDVSAGQGRTVIFVSHNMGAISQLCNRGIVMNQGGVSFDGGTNDAIGFYLGMNNEESSAIYINPFPKPKSDILEISTSSKEGLNKSSFPFDESIELTFLLKVHDDHKNSLIGFSIHETSGKKIFTANQVIKELKYKNETIKVKAKIPSNFLVPGSYMVKAALHIPNMETISVLDSKIGFDIEETGSAYFIYQGADYGVVFADIPWVQV